MYQQHLAKPASDLLSSPNQHATCVCALHVATPTGYAHRTGSGSRFGHSKTSALPNGQVVWELSIAINQNAHLRRTLVLGQFFASPSQEEEVLPHCCEPRTLPDAPAVLVAVHPLPLVL